MAAGVEGGACDPPLQLNQAARTCGAAVLLYVILVSVTEWSVPFACTGQTWERFANQNIFKLLQNH